MQNDLLRAQLMQHVILAMRQGRALATALGAIEPCLTGDGFRRSIIAALRERRIFDGLDEADLARLADLLEREPAWQDTGLLPDRDHPRPIDGRIAPEDVCATSCDARRARLLAARQRLAVFTELREQVFDIIAAREEMMPD